IERQPVGPMVVIAASGSTYRKPCQATLLLSGPSIHFRRLSPIVLALGARQRQRLSQASKTFLELRLQIRQPFSMTVFDLYERLFDARERSLEQRTRFIDQRNHVGNATGMLTAQAFDIALAFLKATLKIAHEALHPLHSGTARTTHANSAADRHCRHS